MDAVSVPVEQDLDLDVARAVQQTLQDQPVVAEGAAASRRGGSQRIGQVDRVAHDAHPLPAPPAAGLTSSGRPTRAAFGSA